MVLTVSWTPPSSKVLPTFLSDQICYKCNFLTHKWELPVWLHNVIWTDLLCPVIRTRVRGSMCGACAKYNKTQFSHSVCGAISSELKTCHGLCPIISRPKWMSGLCPPRAPSFKSPYWLKRPVTGCYCQICKGATQDKWLHSIIMSQSTRQSNNTIEGFKSGNLPLAS